MWEGAGDRTETAIFWPPLLWPSMLCLSRSPDAQPEPSGPALCWMMAFFTASYQHLLRTPTHQGPKPLRPGVAFPTTLVYNSVSNCNWNWNYLISVLTELYNISTTTQSLTWFLESHVGSSSSGNNCHAVHRSLSSGASVYESTIGIFLPLPISSANFRPRDFLS